MFKSISKSGYVALMSALIISAVIILIVTVIGQVSFLGRSSIADVHFKEKSRALAEGCVNEALLKLSSSSSYAGNETINVASDTCKILSVAASSSGRIISTQAQFHNSFTNYRVTIASSAVSILGWEEVQGF
jgi:hypothetical protein